MSVRHDENRDELTEKILIDEFTRWYAKYGNGRDNRGLRFAQAILIGYQTIGSPVHVNVFYEENASTVFSILLGILNEPQV